MDRVAFSMLQDALVAEGSDITFDTVFNCDLQKDKRAFANRVHAALHPSCPTPCNYDNLVTLATADRHCDVHNAACPVPSNLDIAIGGLSCRDFARCRNDKQKGADVYRSASSPGRSADCMHGFNALVDHMSPEIIIIENVDELAEGHVWVLFSILSPLAPSPFLLLPIHK